MGYLAKSYVLQVSIKTSHRQNEYLNSSCLFSPDGLTIATTRHGEPMKLWCAQSGNLIHTFKIPRSTDLPELKENRSNRQINRVGHYISCFEFTSDGDSLLSGHFDGALRLWNVASGSPQHTYAVAGCRVAFLSVCPTDKNCILCCDRFNHRLMLWDVELKQPRQLEGHRGRIMCACFSPCGTLVISGSGDTTLLIWRRINGALERVFTGHSSPIEGCAFSANPRQTGQLVVSWCFGSEPPILWNPTNGRTKTTLKGHSGHVNSACFSPSGKTIATASGDCSLRLWSSTDGSLLHSLEGHKGEVVKCIFSADCKAVASLSWDTTLKIWNAETGGLKQTLGEDTSRICDFQFHPDGKSLIGTCVDGTMHVWG